MKTLIVVLALSMSSCLGLEPRGRDETDPSRCVDASIPKGSVAEHGGGLDRVGRKSSGRFLRGIYAMNPSPSVRGCLMRQGGARPEVNRLRHGLVFFIDGEKACTPMQIPARTARPSA